MPKGIVSDPPGSSGYVVVVGEIKKLEESDPELLGDLIERGIVKSFI